MSVRGQQPFGRCVERLKGSGALKWLWLNKCDEPNEGALELNQKLLKEG